MRNMDDEIKKSGRLFFSNELILSRILIAWTLGCVVLFGVFGSGNLVINLVKKVNLYKEMRQLNYDLNVKLQYLSKLNEEVRIANRYRPALEESIPDGVDTHDYMVSFTQAVSDSGYGVKNFIPSDENLEGEIPISVVLLGAGDISVLVSKIEALSRVTIIDSLNYSAGSDFAEIRLNVRIFKL